MPGRRVRDTDMLAGAAVGVQMVAVARRAARQPAGQRGGAALEIEARTDQVVGVDYYGGIVVGHLLAADRRHDGLVVDAGVGHQHAQRLERGNGAAFQIERPGLLLQPRGGGKIGAARVGDGGDADAALRFRQRGHPFQPCDAGRDRRRRRATRVLLLSGSWQHHVAA